MASAAALCSVVDRGSWPDLSAPFLDLPQAGRPAVELGILALWRRGVLIRAHPILGDLGRVGPEPPPWPSGLMPRAALLLFRIVAPTLQSLQYVVTPVLPAAAGAGSNSASQQERNLFSREPLNTASHNSLLLVCLVFA